MDEPSKIQSMAEKMKVETDRAVAKREEDRAKQASKYIVTLEQQFTMLVVPQIKLKALQGKRKFSITVFGDDGENNDIRDWLASLRCYNLINTLAAMARALPYGFVVDVNHDQTMITFGW